jgi:hypothetical protein
LLEGIAQAVGNPGLVIDQLAALLETQDTGC